MTGKIPVSILGATGTVGQKFVRLLADHPWFEIAAVAASSASAGRRYGDVVRWREQVPLPDRVANLMIQECVPPLAGPIAFSALDADVAGPIEQAFARAVAEIAATTQRLLDELVTTAPARDREVEAAKARARAAVRFGTAA